MTGKRVNFIFPIDIWDGVLSTVEQSNGVYRTATEYVLSAIREKLARGEDAPPTTITEEAPAIIGTKEQKIEALRALMQTTERRSAASTPTTLPPAAEEEVRGYNEYDEQRGEDIQVSGTFTDMVKRYGKLRAVAIWKQSKPPK